tara:strand:- start:2159 stop:3358 length:1200 start_codon:yes stop_codon:yes gene_type:complete
MRVNYGQSVHGDDEIKAVIKVLKNSTQMGESVNLFENSIKKLFSKKYATMVNSGSSALFIAFEVLNIKEGSEVITPVLTFGTTVSAILKNGLIPKFVDVERDTYCMDLNQIERLITKKTKAICAVNLLGNLPDLKKLRAIAKKYNLILIEDSADTLGATLNNRYSGFYTDVSITSFYGSHIINGAGNGGMVCFNDKKYYEKSLLLRSWGRSSSLFKENSEKIENRFNIDIDGIPYDKKFVFEQLGYNLEPSEISAAFANVQLKKLKKNIKIRQKNFKSHIKFFKKYPKLFRVPIERKNVSTCWLAFPIIIKEDAKFTRKDLQIFLEKKNIQTRVVFTGNILRQPGFKYLATRKERDKYIKADEVMKSGMLLGCHHGLNRKHLSYIYKNIEDFINKNHQF